MNTINLANTQTRMVHFRIFTYVCWVLMNYGATVDSRSDHTINNHNCQCMRYGGIQWLGHDWWMGRGDMHVYCSRMLIVFVV